MVSTRTMSNVSDGGESSATTTSMNSNPTTSTVVARNHLSKPRLTTSLCLANIVDVTEPNLQYLPLELIEKIVSYVPHRTIGQLRLVSRQMDSICGGILNFKFQRLQTLMLARFQAIKAKMPRRESARRSHPLACEADIIETLHMRLTLLQMTFGKHIERKHCCFFAGEILDECYRIINYIKITQKLQRPYKVTDELFDLSTMAMEYFKEHIEPTLPEIAYFSSSDFLDFTASPYSSNQSHYLAIEDTPPPTTSTSKATSSKTFVAPAAPQSNMVLRNNIRRIKQSMKRYNNQLSLMRRDLRAFKSKVAEQQKQILDTTSRLDDSDKKNEEYSRKFGTFLQELNKCKTELQYWRSKSPAIAFPPNCDACGKLFDPAPTEEMPANILPDVLPDLNIAVQPVAAVVNEEAESKLEESNPGVSKCSTAKDSKIITIKDMPKAVILKRKIEDNPDTNETKKIDELKAGSSKAKESKKAKCVSLKDEEKASTSDNHDYLKKTRQIDDTTAYHDPKKPRRILKPRGKQGKIFTRHSQ